MDKSLIFLFANNAFNLSGDNLGLPTRLQNPGDILVAVVQTMMILVGMLAVIFLIIGGFQMVGSAGSPQRFKQGRESVIYSIIGIIIAISAYAIVGFIAGAVN